MQTEGWTNWGEPFESNLSDDDDILDEDNDDTGIECEPPIFVQQELAADRFSVLPTGDAPNTESGNPN